MSVVERALNKLRLTESTTAPHSGAPATPPPAREAIGSLVEGRLSSEQGARIHVDRDAVRRAGYLPDADQDRRFADEYRQIKRPILTTAFTADASQRGPSPRLVMMASALPGDGKTFTSINLALSLARERDSSVVLVDADVAKPHVSSIFGLDGEPGLLDALADPAIDTSALILQTDVPGLAILPAGKPREGATELLASNRMSEIAASILARHPRCIALFDSSPLLVSSESRALSVAMGQVVMVVRVGQTPRHAVLEAIETLESAGKEGSISLILNQGRRSLLERYYGYSYGEYGQEARVEE